MAPMSVEGVQATSVLVYLASAPNPSVISKIPSEGKTTLPMVFPPMPLRAKQAASAFRTV